MKNLIRATTLLVLVIMVGKCLVAWEQALIIAENYPQKCIGELVPK